MTESKLDIYIEDAIKALELVCSEAINELGKLPDNCLDAMREDESIRDKMPAVVTFAMFSLRKDMACKSAMDLLKRKMGKE